MKVSSQIHASANLPTGKKPNQASLVNRRLGGAPDLGWTLWSTGKSLAPAGNRTVICRLSTL